MFKEKFNNTWFCLVLMELHQLLSKKLNLQIYQIKNTIALMDADKTIPFIARYRKDQTGGLDAETLHEFKKDLDITRRFIETKEKARSKLLELHKEKLLPVLDKCVTTSDINELMQPFKSKRKTRASVARDMGLQPVADIIMGREKGDLDHLLAQLSDATRRTDNTMSKKDLLEMSLDIVAEETISHPEAKKIAVNHLLNNVVKITFNQDAKKTKKYLVLENIHTTPSNLHPHQIHAIFRAEEEKVINLTFATDEENIAKKIDNKRIFLPESKYKQYFFDGLLDGTKRLLISRAETTVRNILKEKADKRAITVFKKNLQDLLLTPPIEPTVVLAIDPGYKTGCKIAVISSEGDLLTTAVIYPTPPREDLKSAKKIINNLITNYQIGLIVIGNGTGSKETTTFIEEHIAKDTNIQYAVVAETGASVYSASKVAREEFPDLDVEIRGAISIARRVLDPLNEFVKIDPRSLGVGQYQHEVHKTVLDDALHFTVSDAVNKYGIELSTASKSALTFVSGISSNLAENIIKFREEKGFSTREDLLKVDRLGIKTYEQCSGFLRLKHSKNLLDKTMIHPSEYKIAEEILTDLSTTLNKWLKLDEKGREKLIQTIKYSDYVRDDTGEQSIKDICQELLSIGRDSRGTREFHKITGQKDSIEDLNKGDVLTGKIVNVVDFGAFVDIGIKYNGLIHKSNLADKYIHDVFQIVQVNQIIKVEVLDVDIERKRISLKCI